MKNIPIRKIATLQKIENPQGKFSIRPVSDILKGDDIIHDLHRHDFYFILAIDKGEGIHEIDFTKFDVTNKSVFILRPGQVHYLELKKNSNGFLIEFDAAFYKPNDTSAVERLKKATRKNFCKINAGKFDLLLAPLNNIYREFTDKHEGYIEAIKANIDIFFIEQIRQSQSAGHTNQYPNSYNQERFEELTELLDSRIAEFKTVSQYADVLNLSVYQLNAITKAIVGKTVSDLISDQILLEAKRYLLATSSQVKDIAYHLGYEDVSYFIRFFKKHTNSSPEAYRQKFK